MDQHKLIDSIIKQVTKNIEDAIAIGKEDFFEIHIKHINGDIVSKLEVSDKVKVHT